MNNQLNSNGTLNSPAIPKGVQIAGETPFYFYDEEMIREQCRKVLSMPNAFGITVRYAMKANSNLSILKIIAECGLSFDASSLNEVKVGRAAGIPIDRILLTTQEVPEGKERESLEGYIREGLKYNVCSLRQLRLIAPFAKANAVPLSVRLHPGTGSGESATRNTGDKYSCFGVHSSDIDEFLQIKNNEGIAIERVHVHIGSGGDPAAWRDNIDKELDLLKRHFSEARIVNFGGGLKVARMPDEEAADIVALGNYAKEAISEYANETGRQLMMEIEPGNFIIANAGYAVTKVIDTKQTGEDGFHFLISDGGMEINARPLLYGARHPFYVVSPTGELLYREGGEGDGEFVIVGRCCESGDSQTLNSDGTICPRIMKGAAVGDYLVTGGTGGYCAAMTPFNYNSHTQAPEVLFLKNGDCRLIRRPQTLEEMLAGEL